MSNSIILWVRGKDNAGRALALIYEPGVYDIGSSGRSEFSQTHYPVDPKTIDIDPHNRRQPPVPLKTDSKVPALDVNQIVLATVSLGWPEGDAAILRVGGDIHILGTASKAEDALIICEEEERRDRRPYLISTTYVTSDQVEYEAEAERVRHQPNEALVVSWRGSPTSQENESYVIAHKGAYLFHAMDQGSSVEDVGLERPPGPGLWIMTGGQYWSSTSYESFYPDDWGMSGDYAPATFAEAAAAFGMSEDTIIAEIDEMYPYQFEGSVMDALHRPEGVVAAEASPAGGPA